MRAALICSFLFLSWSAALSYAQPPGALRDQARPQHRTFHTRRAPDGRFSHFPHLRDGQTSALPGPLFRQAMLQDIRQHVPLLHEKMESIAAMQEERQKLQAKKREAAQATGKSEAKLQRFHELLRREDAVTSRQKALMAETAGDAEDIRAQVALRRAQIEARLQEIAPGAEPHRCDLASSEARFLTRAARVYETVEQKLAALQENPRRSDWARSLFKGMLFGGDEPDDFRRDRAERRLKELREEQEKLRRRMQQVQREIDGVREELGHDRQPGPRHRSGAGRRPPGGEGASPPPPAPVPPPEF